MSSKLTFMIINLLLSTGLCQIPGVGSDTLNIIFVGGQSNMLALRADAQQLPVSELDSSIAYYYHIGFKPGTHPTPFIATSGSTWTHLQTQTQVPYIVLQENFFGPEMTLARTLHENGVVNLGIFKIGYGATNLAQDWKKGDETGALLYEILMSELRSATDSLKRWEVPWKFIGMAWMQGETDGLESQWAADYEANLNEFIFNVRSDFNAEAMPIVLGKIANTGVRTYAGQVRAAQAAVADSDPLVELIDLDDLPIEADGIHFTTDGIMAMGTRMAQSILSTTSIDGDYYPSELLINPVLNENYPNPFNPTTTISYSLAVPANLTLTVYDISGVEITTLKNGYQDSGYYDIQWNGKNQSGNPVSTGVYFCRLQAGDYNQTIKMVYLR